MLKSTTLTKVIIKTTIGSKYLLKAWAQPGSKEKTVLSLLQVLSNPLIQCPLKASSVLEPTKILTSPAALLEIVLPREALIDQAFTVT